MAKQKLVEIKSNAREFIKKLDKASKRIQKDLMLGFGAWLLDAKKQAVNYMEPNKFAGQSFNIWKNGEPTAFIRRQSWRAGKSVQRLAWVQKGHPTKTTIRTGLLRDIVTADGQWDVSTSGHIAKLRGNGQWGKHSKGWIRPQYNSGKLEYIARLILSPANGEAFIDARLNNETGRGMTRYGARKARPFLRPAIDGYVNKWDPIVMRHIASAINVTL